jgi:hypothetical protein
MFLVYGVHPREFIEFQPLYCSLKGETEAARFSREERIERTAKQERYVHADKEGHIWIR